MAAQVAASSSRLPLYHRWAVAARRLCVPLRTLAASDEALAGRIAEMAAAHLGEVDAEEVAADLYALEVEEVWDRAGETRYGYVEPGEAANQMIEEVLEPWLADLDRYQKLGLNVEANEMGMGLLLGLYRFERESRSDWSGRTGSCCTGRIVRWPRKGRSACRRR